MNDQKHEDDDARRGSGDYMLDHESGGGGGADSLDMDRDRAHRRRLVRAQHWRWVLDTGLLVVILVLVLRLQAQSWSSARTCSAPAVVDEIGGDLTGVTPRFARQIVRFQHDEAFMPQNSTQFFTASTKKKWLDLVPKGLGYQVVANPARYDNLPHPLPEYGPDKTVFTTSMTHQLHCLYALAEVYAAYSASPPRAPPDTAWHVPHCVDYLRQAIMCAGDVALEGTQTTFPLGVEGSDGWDGRHVCRDYGQVHDYLEKVRVDDVRWV